MIECGRYNLISGHFPHYSPSQMKLDLKPELPVAAISTSEPPFERKMCDVRVEELHEMSFRRSISDLSALDEISPSLRPPSSEAATQAQETITPPKLEPPSKEYVERIAACCNTVVCHRAPCGGASATVRALAWPVSGLGLRKPRRYPSGSPAHTVEPPGA